MPWRDIRPRYNAQNCPQATDALGDFVPCIARIMGKRIQGKLHCTLALIVLSTSACGLLDNVIPETAGDSAGDSVVVAPNLSSSGTRSLPATITGVRVEVLDVLLHDPTRDAWYILNDHVSVWDLLDPGEEDGSFSGVPVLAGTYDQIEVVLGGAEVRENGSWHGVPLKTDSSIYFGEIVVEEDIALTVNFDLTDALIGDAAAGYVFAPKIDVTVER